MTFVRMQVSTYLDATTLAKDAITNTLYFNVTQVGEPDYQALVNDLWTIFSTRPWVTGRILDVRAYNMDDAKPRPVKGSKRAVTTGTIANGPPQIALCLSYYADRNLPRQRGRIYLGPWSSPDRAPSTTITTNLMTLAPALAGLGGVNVDWSLWSPTTGQHTRINHAWVDDSWDVIRSRKIAPLNPRRTWEGDG